MKQINSEQIEIIKAALEKAKHKGYEDCSAEVCEMITKAVKELRWIEEQNDKN